MIRRVADVLGSSSDDSDKELIKLEPFKLSKFMHAKIFISKNINHCLSNRGAEHKNMYIVTILSIL